MVDSLLSPLIEFSYMEASMWAIVIIPLLAAIFTTLVAISWECIVRMLLVHRVFISDKIIREMDKFLLEKSGEHDIMEGSTKKPTDTWHMRRFVCGFIIASRSTTHEYQRSREQYSLYGTKHAMTSLMKKIDNDNDSSDLEMKSIGIDCGYTQQVNVVNFESSSPWKTSFIAGKEALPSRLPYLGQRDCVDAIVSAYETRINNPDNRKCLSVLLMGSPGTGKTNSSLFLAHRLKGRVVFGYDLTTPGVSLDDLWRMNPSKESPVILNLDEIDGAINQAEKAEIPKQFRCLAQNKTAFNGLMDRFGRTQFLIVLGTSNISFEQLWTKYPSYLRKGRFDLCFTLNHTDCVTERNE